MNGQPLSWIAAIGVAVLLVLIWAGFFLIAPSVRLLFRGYTYLKGIK